MACACKKNRVATQPVNKVKTTSAPKKSGMPNKRIIRRLSK